MEKEYRPNNSSVRERETLLRSSSDNINNNKQTTSSDFVLQWGNVKRLRCMKFQSKDKDKDKDKDDSSGPNHKAATARVDRRVVRADKDSSNHHHPGSTNGYLNLRQRPSSPPPPPTQRVLRWEARCMGTSMSAPSSYPSLTVVGQWSWTWSFAHAVYSILSFSFWNSENSSAMRGHPNGSLRGFSSPDRTAHDKRNGSNHHHHHHHHHVNNHHNEGNKSAASSETAHDSKKAGGGGGGGGGSSSGSGDATPPVWPPKFVIALTNKEKEEDFIIFKGSKLPQRPKKRAKMIQRTVNLVCPGTWLCDLTLERYEVREKKISKKRPRGLKAMGNMDSDSE